MSVTYWLLSRDVRRTDILSATVIARIFLKVLHQATYYLLLITYYVR